MEVIRKLRIAAHNTTTYRVGLLQTKAYRALKQHTSKALSAVGISSVEWALIGILYDAKEGIAGGDLADELGVELPFITQSLLKLKKTSYVEQYPDPEDSRRKITRLTMEGRKFVKQTEKYVRHEIKPLIKNVPMADLLSYLSVMQAIIDNAKAFD